MGLKIFYCPRCRAKLEGDEALFNSLFRCPACNQQIDPDMPELPELPETVPATESPETHGQKTAAPQLKQTAAPSETDGGDYFWGRRLVRYAKILAVLILLVGGHSIYDTLLKYRQTVEQIHEKRLLEQVTADLLTGEKALNKSFQHTAALLSGTGMISNGVLNGLNLPSALIQVPGAMPLSLRSSHDIADARDVLSGYIQKNNELKKQFTAAFGNLLQLVRHKNAAIVGTGGDIVMRTGGSRRDFYAQENVQGLILKSLEKYLEEIENELSAENQLSAEQYRILSHAAAAARFTRQKLFSIAEEKTIVRNLQAAAVNSGPADLLAQAVDAAVENIGKLSENWQLDADIAAVSVLLDKAEIYQKQFEKICGNLHEQLISDIIGTLLWCIIAAFLMLAAADFVQSNLDAADLLRKMLKKN